MPKPVFIQRAPSPSPDGQAPKEAVIIEGAEVEALRLVDLEGLSQEEAGQRLGVSRGTVWRLVQSGRRKMAQALAEGRAVRMASAEEEASGAPIK